MAPPRRPPRPRLSFNLFAETQRQFAAQARRAADIARLIAAASRARVAERIPSAPPAPGPNLPPTAVSALAEREQRQADISRFITAAARQNRERLERRRGRAALTPQRFRRSMEFARFARAAGQPRRPARPGVATSPPPSIPGEQAVMDAAAIQAMRVLSPAERAAAQTQMAAAKHRAKLLEERRKRFEFLAAGASAGNRDAIKRLQEDLGLRPTGRLDETTVERVNREYAGLGLRLIEAVQQQTDFTDIRRRRDLTLQTQDQARRAQLRQLVRREYEALGRELFPDLTPEERRQRLEAGSVPKEAKPALERLKLMFEIGADPVRYSPSVAADALETLRSSRRQLETSARRLTPEARAAREQTIEAEFERRLRAARNEGDVRAASDWRQEQLRRLEDTAARSEGRGGRGGLLGFLSDVGGFALRAVENITNRGSAYFAATQLAPGRPLETDPRISLQLAGTAAVGWLGIPGTDARLDRLIAPEHSEARRLWERVNTFDEREGLRGRGLIESLGEYIVPPALDWRVGRVGLTTGVVDLLTIPLKDPTIGAGIALRGGSLGAVAARQGLSRLTAEQIGEIGAARARQLARAEWLRTSTIGRKLTAQIDNALADIAIAGDLKTLRRTFPKLPVEYADRIIQARGSAATEQIARTKAREIIEEAFIRGHWDPDVGLVRRTTARLTGTGLGRRVTRDGFPEAFGRWVRSVGTDSLRSNPHLLVSGSSAADFIDSAIEAAARSTGRVPNALRRSLRRTGDPVDRFYRLFTDLETLNRPGASNLRAIVEARLAPFFGNSKIVERAGIAHYIDAVMATPGFGRALDDLETLVAVAQGKIGAEAAGQLSVDLARGFTPTGRNSFGNGIFQQALRNTRKTGLRLPGKVSREQYERAFASLPDELRTTIEAEQLRLAGDERALARLRKQVAALASDREVAEEAGRLARLYRDADIERTMARASRPGIGRRVATFPGRLLESIADPVAPTRLDLEPFANPDLNRVRLVEATDRIAGAYGLETAAREQVRLAAGKVRTEKDLFALAEQLVRLGAERYGIEYDQLRRLLKETGGFSWTRPPLIRGVDDEGRAVQQLQTIAQLAESAPVPSPKQMRVALRQAIIETAVDATTAERLGAKLGVIVDEVGNFRIPFLNLTIKGGIRGAHRWWKFLIVTNAAAPLIGATAGFLYQDDKASLLDRVKTAGIGLAVGSLNFRYILRVAGIEEGVRKFLTNGINAENWIPGYASWRLKRAALHDPFRRPLSEAAVLAGTYGDSHWGSSLFLHVDETWDIVPRTHPRFVDSWYRIVNHQLHPETDRVALILLAERAKLIGRKEADELLNRFFGGEEGKLFLARFRAGRFGARDPQTIAQRYRDFIDRFVPETLAARRLNGGRQHVSVELLPGLRLTPAQIEHRVLKGLAKEGVAPDSVHGQLAWRVPRKINDIHRMVRRNYEEVVRRGVLAGPTDALNRRPAYRYTFAREYDRLIAEGADPQVAQRLADNVAVERTNQVMFQLADESRFAQSSDIWAPFQQPREEMIRVWGRLIVENPRRSFIAASQAVRFFNAMESTGVFHKNSFGEWVLTVPGSGLLSRIFGMPYEQGQEARIRDLLFIGQGAFDIGIIPTPGGPFWSVISRKLADRHPELFQGDNPITEWLWPYGPGGTLLPKSASRLWMSFTLDTPPWEFATREQQRNELNRWRVRVAQELTYQRRLRGDKDYIPTAEEVDRAAMSLFRTWAFTQANFPAAPYPLMSGKAEFDAAVRAFTGDRPDLVFQPEFRKRFLELYPWFEAHMLRTTEYVGPDDMKHWKNEADPDSWLQQSTLGFRRALSFEEFAAEWEKYRRQRDYFAELDGAWAIEDPFVREQKLTELYRQYPDLYEQFKDNYRRDLDLQHILFGYPKHLQEQAIDRWRRSYDVSYREYQRLVKKVTTEAVYNPWKEARTTEDIVRLVERGGRSAQNVERAVAALPPAEQYKYWRYKAETVTYDPFDTPQNALEEYEYYRKNLRQVTAQYGKILFRPRAWKNPFEEAVEKARGEISQIRQKAFEGLETIKEQMDAAARAKNWKAYYALKEQRKRYQDLLDATETVMWRKFRDLSKMHDELRAMTVYLDHENPRRALEAAVNAMQAAVDAPFVLTNEELRYENMPPQVQHAYRQKLVQALDMPPSDEGFDRDVSRFLKETYGITKLYWEWLSPFQQWLLERTVPPSAIDNWKWQSDYYLHGEGSRRGRRGRRDRTPGFGELQFAYQMFREYNRRGNMPEPAAYREYLNLPNNPAVRADFLRKHPEVAEYIKLGPLANMPVLYREMVINIMVKYGKWSGEVRTVEEITDIAWAREQLRRWSRRPQGAMAPDTYDKWLAMPTGPEKAEYLRQHPEVQAWISAGPMANMPEEYQQIVRDIMYRYGLWSAQQDGLGMLISEFHRLPRGSREEFLRRHPELELYFSLTRTPQERRMHELAERYFAIGDVAARRAFLASHPELQTWMVEQRTRRYERFLNQVAMYMGSNPEMFREYLERQEDVLAELLRRFAEPVLVREVPAARLQIGSGDRRRDTATVGR